MEKRGAGDGGRDKAFDIRLIAEAGDRACARRREGGGCTYIYIYIGREREREDGDSSLKVESWAVAKLNPA